MYNKELEKVNLKSIGNQLNDLISVGSFGLMKLLSWDLVFGYEGWAGNKVSAQVRETCKEQSLTSSARLTSYWSNTFQRIPFMAQKQSW